MLCCSGYSCLVPVRNKVALKMFTFPKLSKGTYKYEKSLKLSNINSYELSIVQNFYWFSVFLGGVVVIVVVCVLGILFVVNNHFHILKIFKGKSRTVKKQLIYLHRYVRARYFLITFLNFFVFIYIRKLFLKLLINLLLIFYGLPVL